MTDPKLVTPEQERILAKYPDLFEKVEFDGKIVLLEKVQPNKSPFRFAFFDQFLIELQLLSRDGRTVWNLSQGQLLFSITQMTIEVDDPNYDQLDEDTILEANCLSGEAFVESVLDERMGQLGAYLSTQ